jgi:predicted nucleotidyltransferase
MRAEPPALLPLLRSQVQGNLLALTYLNPEQEYTVTEAARRIGASVKATQQEVDRLVVARILADRRQGNNRLVRAVTDSLLSRPLTDLLVVTYGPMPVLTEELRKVPGIGKAFLYGSWAARYSGEAGPPPNDVDVLVVGDADPDDLDLAAQRAEGRLGGREVNIRRVRASVWEQPPNADAFLSSIRSRPLIELAITYTEAGT